MKLNNKIVNNLAGFQWYFSFVQLWEKMPGYRTMAEAPQSDFYSLNQVTLTERILELWDTCENIQNMASGKMLVPVSESQLVPWEIHEAMQPGAALRKQLQEILMKYTKLQNTLCRQDPEPPGIHFGNSGFDITGELQKVYEQAEKKYQNQAIQKVSRFLDENHKQLQIITKNGMLITTDASLAMLCLFLLLHFQAEWNIGEADGDHNAAEVMQESLQKLNEQYEKVQFTIQTMQLKAKHIRIRKEGEEYFLAACDTKSLQSGFPLEVVKITNETEHFKKLRIGETAQIACLDPGESVWAMRKHRGFLYFMPRFTFYEDHCMYAVEKKMYIKGDNTWLKPGYDAEPVSWGFTDCYGLMVLDAEGKLHYTWGKYPFPKEYEDVVSISTYRAVYCMLTKDGTVHSNLPGIDGCTGVIRVRAGLNNVIAIMEDGTIRLARGTVVIPEGTERPVDAWVYDEHYIWKDEKGCIHADCGDHNHQAYAISIGWDGYEWLSGNKRYIYTYGGDLKTEDLPYNVGEVAEIEGRKKVQGL